MATLATKLQLPAGAAVTMINPPDGLTLDLQLTPSTPDSHDALLAFASTNAALLDLVPALTSASLAGRLTWIAYPKAGQLGTDLNRDRLAAALAPFGLQPVRQIAIDDVWSALRLRPA